MFLLESPHRSDSIEYTQYTIFNIKNQPKLFWICSYEILSKGVKNEFETAVLNEPSVFEPLKVYSIWVFTSEFWKIIHKVWVPDFLL